MLSIDGTHVCNTGSKSYLLHSTIDRISMDSTASLCKTLIQTCIVAIFMVIHTLYDAS